MATEQEYTQDEMYLWLTQKARVAATATARRKMLSFEERARDSAFVGNLYFFRYDPKMKATLSQYDKFPMALILEWKNDGFLGLNLHYLPRGQRAAMLGIFSKYKEDYKLRKNSTSGKSVNWANLMDSLDGTKAQQLPKQCLKRYLWGHVTSHFVEIYPEEYSIATQLPVEDWVFKR